MKKYLIAIPLLLCAALPAVAGVTITPTLKDVFTANAVIRYDAKTSGGHADGAVIVGGNWSGNDYEVGGTGRPRLDSTTFSTSTFTGSEKDAFWVGGTVSLAGNFGLRARDGDSTGLVNQTTSNAKVGNTSGKSISASGTKIDLNSVFDTLTGISGYIAALSPTTATKIDTSDQNNRKVNLTNLTAISNTRVLQESFYFLSIEASALTKGTLDINGGKGTTPIIINIVGDVSTWNLSVNYNPELILWNYSSADEFVVGGRLGGSLLAPSAKVTQTGSGLIQGQLIAASWENQGSAEIHYRPFAGTVVPEPSTALAGLLLACGIMRRRRR